MGFHFVFQNGDHISTWQRRQRNFCSHIINAQFSTLQHNYVATFKALVGKIGQVLGIEASNLAIKQPT
jgi:hypothetical protein